MPSKELVINQAWCKGCGICIEYCNKEVLSLESGKVKTNKSSNCVFCGLCELRCPDYAIHIENISQK